MTSYLRFFNSFKCWRKINLARFARYLTTVIANEKFKSLTIEFSARLANSSTFFGQILLLISIMEKCIVLHDIIFAFASISTYFRRFFPNSHKKVWHFKDDFFQKKKLHLFCLQTSFYCTISMSNLQFCIILGLRKLNLEGYLSIIKISLQKS